MSSVKHHLHHEVHKHLARFHRRAEKDHEAQAEHMESDHDCEKCAEFHKARAAEHGRAAEHHEERAEELASPDFGDVDAHTRESTKAAGVSAINRNPEMGERNMVRRAGQPTRELSAALEPEFEEMLKIEG